MGELVETVSWLIVLGTTAVLYLLPTLVASRRGHPNAGPIAALNLLLGWTGVGWIAALIWSGMPCEQAVEGGLAGPH
jgi:hypothetical protein